MILLLLGSVPIDDSSDATFRKIVARRHVIIARRDQIGEARCKYVLRWGRL
jgi:hypothetical protein